LPDGGKVNTALAKIPEDPNEIILNGSVAVLYTVYTISESQNFALDVTSVGTRYQGATTHEIKEYLITTGLGRLYPTSELSLKKTPLTKDITFLSRATFWQSHGSTGYHRRSWLLNPKPTYPSVQSCTRNEKVTAIHPHRPSKPQPGEVLYRR
jgi:hypothetical protein